MLRLPSSSANACLAYNHALQRTRPSRHCCNPSISRAGSLSLGRYGWQAFDSWASLRRISTSQARTPVIKSSNGVQSPRLIFPNDSPSPPVTTPGSPGDSWEQDTPAPAGIAGSFTSFRLVGTSYKGSGAGVDPNVTNPLVILVRVRACFSSSPNRKKSRTLRSLNSWPTRVKFFWSVALSARLDGRMRAMRQPSSRAFWSMRSARPWASAACSGVRRRSPASGPERKDGADLKLSASGFAVRKMRPLFSCLPYLVLLRFFWSLRLRRAVRVLKCADNLAQTARAMHHDGDNEVFRGPADVTRLLLGPTSSSPPS